MNTCLAKIKCTPKCIPSKTNQPQIITNPLKGKNKNKENLRGQKGEKKTHIRLLSAKQCERRERDWKSIKKNHDESLAKFTQ